MHNINQHHEGRILSKEPVYGFLGTLQKNIRESVQNRIWQWRIFILFYCIYIGIRYACNPGYWSLFGWFNFGIHELGHLIIPGPKLPHMLAGSVVQCSAPLIGFFIFWRQRDYFGSLSVSFVWLATNLYYVSWYMADADQRAIPLLSPFEQGQHDWHFIFVRIGLYEYDDPIAACVRWGGHICMWTGIVFGIWVLWLMAMKSKGNRQ